MDEFRRKKIMDFLADNQGCSVQKLYRDVKEYMARMTMYRNLDELKKEGLVIHEKNQYRRDSKLFLVTNNLLVLVPKQLEKFKSDYMDLVDKAIKKVKKNKKKIDTQSSRDLLMGVIDLYHMTVNAYLFRSTLNWPQKIHDKDTLNRLNINMLSTLAEIQLELFQKLAPLLGQVIKLDMLTNISGWRLIGNDPVFKKFNLKKEKDQVIGKIYLELLHGNPDDRDPTRRFSPS